ncbi:MAG: phosphotransferase [Nocardioides sp.]
MGPDVERPLVGGAQTAGLVCVGETVRRLAHGRSTFVQDLLWHLQAAGFSGAPRALGFDDRGRETVSFVPGEVPAGPPYRLEDRQLTAAAVLVRAFHDATVSSPLRGDQEVVCHSDLGPHNTVFRGGLPVAIIDWDADVGPGRRADDFAHAVWCFADVTERVVPVTEQARRIALMCESYPGMTPEIVVRELAERFTRARDAHATAGREGGVAVFEELLGWLDRHADELSRPARPSPA